MEIWKDINNFEHLYQVSNLGNVRNKITQNILTGDINSAGYRRVILYDKSRKLRVRWFIHRLVAIYFCDGFMPDLVVNHKDGNKLNNRADNLEFVTRSENDLHAFRLGLRKVTYIPQKPEYLIRVFDINTNETLKLFHSKQELSEYYNISVLSISEMITRGHFGRGEILGIERIKPSETLQPIKFYN